MTTFDCRRVHISNHWLAMKTAMFPLREKTVVLRWFQMTWGFLTFDDIHVVRSTSSMRNLYIYIYAYFILLQVLYLNKVPFALLPFVFQSHPPLLFSCPFIIGFQAKMTNEFSMILRSFLAIPDLVINNNPHE